MLWRWRQVTCCRCRWSDEGVSRLNAGAVRILVIEDEPDSIRLLLAYLRDFYPDILVARNGLDGIEKARKGKPDLILLDMGLPGVNGIEVCRLLKADEQTEPIPVIFLTAYAFIENKLQAFEAGAVDYITKPFSEREVLARIGVHARSSLRARWIDRRVSAVFETTRMSAENRDHDLLVRACDYLQEHLSESKSLTELSRDLRTTERRLDSLFRSQLGLSVFEYTNELRLSVARTMLMDASIQIRQIAWQVGYVNPGDLSRAFRKRFGMTPRSYRENVAGAQPEAGDPLD